MIKLLSISESGIDWRHALMIATFTIITVVITIGIISIIVYKRKKKKTSLWDHYIQAHLDGNPNTLDVANDLKGRIQNIPYNKKREIERRGFEIDGTLGSGNFGKVEKGTVIGLCGLQSKTIVAIKSVHEVGSEGGIKDLMSETRWPNPKRATTTQAAKATSKWLRV